MMESCNHNCSCHSNPSPYNQTISEMDFARGVWTAAMDGDLQNVKSYLEKGGNPNATDSSGYTPLHYASRNGRIKVCEVLLSQGACPNAQTRSGNVTPLHRAAYCGHLEIVTLLLQCQADPSICDADGQIPLHKAAEKGQRDIIQLLIDRSPELMCVKDKRGRVPLDVIPKNRPDLKDLFQKC